MMLRFVAAFMLVIVGVHVLAPSNDVWGAGGSAVGSGAIPSRTPQPVPPPPGSHPGQPGLAIAGRTGAFGYLHTLDYPPNFHFRYLIEGFGFKPGEAVIVTVEHGAAPPVTARADAAGSFAVRIHLRWLFCGPSAVRRAPPIFVARGSLGSVARRPESRPQCPLLTVENWAVQTPGGSGSGAGSGIIHATPASTVASVPMEVPLPPVPRAARVAPQMVTMDVAGFGFVPGEAVTVRVTHLDRFPTLPVIHRVADHFGRLRFSARAYYIYSSCGPGPTTPQLLARGNRGTRGIAYIPMGTLGAPCFHPPPTATPGSASMPHRRRELPGER